MEIAPSTKSRRRSTRVARAVFLTVTGIGSDGQPFEEQTGTMELSFHGCRYFSRHAVVKDSWLTLQEIPTEKIAAPAQAVRARVVSVRKSQRLPGLLQVGVELESPGNIWNLASPPEDWRESGVSRETDVAAFQNEIKEMLALATTGTYYQILRVSSESSRAQIKSSYYELVRKFHPDLHMDHPEWTAQIQKITDSITLAYKTLTDDALHRAYDRQLAASGAFTLGEIKSDKRKTAEECALKGRECFRAGNYGGAILWFREAIEIEPGSAKYQALLARSLTPVAQYRREAAEHYQKAIEIDPLNTTVQFQLGQLYEQMRVPWRAQNQYQKILEIDPEHGKARERLQALQSAASHKTKSTFVDRILRRPTK
jgi:tetratricopeptide (TPR) repeat protein